MPTYEYRCDACGHNFEKFQSITAPAVRKCPKCGKRSVRRGIGGGAGILFKGSGFYQTDYRSKNYHEGAKKETPEKKKEKGSTETSSGNNPSSKPSSGPPSGKK